jgi:uncharacterized protein (TIGR02466 family)
MDGFAYFPAIIYRDERPDLVENTLSASAHYLDEARKLGWSLCQSTPLMDDPAFKGLANYILLSAADILRGQGYAVEQYDFYLSGLWAQEINRGAATDVHVHRNSQVCGWFFLETPEGGAYPIYHDTRTNKAMIELDFVQGEDVSNATNSIHFNNVVPGTVMFANSWMRHQLSVNNADAPTRCVHFIVSHKERLCSTC